MREMTRKKPGKLEKFEIMERFMCQKTESEKTVFLCACFFYFVSFFNLNLFTLIGGYYFTILYWLGFMFIKRAMPKSFENERDVNNIFCLFYKELFGPRYRIRR